MDSGNPGERKLPPSNNRDGGLVWKVQNPDSAQKLGTLNSKMLLEEGDRKKAAQSVSAQMMIDAAETPEHLSMNIVKQQFLYDPTLPAADKALFVQEAAEHACKSARPGEKHSPSTITLFQRFKDLSNKLYSTVGVGNQLKRAAAHSYVNEKNGHPRHSLYTPTDLFPKAASTKDHSDPKASNPPSDNPANHDGKQAVAPRPDNDEVGEIMLKAPSNNGVLPPDNG